MAKSAKGASAPRTWISAAMVRSLGGDPVAIVRTGWTGLIGGRFWRLPTVTHGHLDFLYNRNLTAWLVNPEIDEGSSKLIIPTMNRRPADPGVAVPIEFCREEISRAGPTRVHARILEVAGELAPLPARVDERDKAIQARFRERGEIAPNESTIRRAFKTRSRRR